MGKKIISIIIIFCLVIITNYKTLAVTSADYKKQSEEAQKKLEDVEGQINEVLQDIENLNTSISTIEKEVESLTTEINKLNDSIKHKEEDLGEKQKLLDERLAVAYRKGNNTYLEALFSGGLINFISNYDMIKQIAEYDTNLINEVKNAKEELETEKRTVENVKIQKEAKSSDLKKLKSEKETKVNNLTEDQKQIQAQIEEYDNKMKELEKKERELAAQEAKKNQYIGSSGENFVSSGRFQWPVPSSQRVTSEYGYRIHPISGTRKLHAGIDIGAAGGANIVAGDSGTVILSSFGYNGGYGNYVIINHGNGVTTRYAHCSNLYVSVGQTVTKGQVIAAVGSTGASTGNHCHFEVRINGVSQNPRNYL